MAVAVVVAVEEPPLLMPVQRVVGGVEVEHDLLRRALVGVEKQVDEQRLDRGAVVGDPAVAVGFRAAMLEPVERALAGERRAAPVPRLEPTKRHPEHRVVTQPIVVDQVLVAERDAEHPLPDQRRHLVDQPIRRPAIGEAGREALDEPDGPIGRPEQQPAGVRGDRSAFEIRHHSAAIDPFRIPSASRYTLSASGSSPDGTEVFVAEALCPLRDPDAPTSGEKCGLAGMNGRFREDAPRRSASELLMLRSVRRSCCICVGPESPQSRPLEGQDAALHMIGGSGETLRSVATRLEWPARAVRDCGTKAGKPSLASNFTGVHHAVPGPTQ